METVKLTTHIGSDGILKLETPVSLRDTDADILVVIVPRKPITRQEWEFFLEQTYASLPHDAD
jgi:hypothetical protein